MALIVQKYGGTSVGNVERIQNVAQKVRQFVAEGHQVVVTVSAMSGETNRLTALANEIQSQPCKREMDVLLTTGEQVTIALLSMALQEIGVSAVSYTGWQVAIRTNDIHSKARIEGIDAEKINHQLSDGKVVIVAGFQGVTDEGDITTLGRGGSDTTAVALAAALKADECQIYTDVDGVYTTDPRVVPEARRLDYVTFDEMLELASLGAKVLQIRSVEFASKYKVPLRVLSSLKEGGGTLLISEEDFEGLNMEKPLISGIAFSRDEAKLMILGVPDRPGVAFQILGPISDANIEIDMIIQNQGVDGTTDFTFTVSRGDLRAAKAILEETAATLGAREILCDDTIVKISMVGVGMKSHSGIASKMFKVLAENEINIQMIGTTEIKISVVIHESMLETAVQALHQAFELDQ
ncbi:MAG: aspartate kinase [Piscirickettsiaceae bacterium CG_4_9_14_3_um_filter_43_564]|nr:aspartate kinase [Thiomicrospira sp.]OIP93774.1 MAG: aspartate kinase [Thiomicrospira sp. CG2_30_44_34]PIQ06392.1 MAG: aspartate kinase [Piscirickettsiaceae bacterium CG18_big_fil_WC_8_21_14_2_50_44_103]PIU37865.1 MAG: aspartate kinase [Piscirickettsiaceae bacterium CG07_land_8_20_14_0_80_44_28]PIW57240.1 MAG: aspartate kinase [Piscirickettsiaceae bacterium CG12_big_fil_rev_8_21_14_0_65_44_934]PIW77911.1 MAG: aspartate kinase [Piscirickettsiaceae bacterium CG_4_8_14_3_um_filter_44_38]PIX80